MQQNAATVVIVLVHADHMVIYFFPVPCVCVKLKSMQNKQTKNV